MLKNIISSIPRGTSISNWASLWFGSSIGGELLDASFWLDFSENTNSSTMLGAIESKINEMKRNKVKYRIYISQHLRNSLLRRYISIVGAWRSRVSRMR
jgi:hypothetical protein